MPRAKAHPPSARLTSPRRLRTQIQRGPADVPRTSPQTRGAGPAFRFLTLGAGVRTPLWGLSALRRRAPRATLSGQEVGGGRWEGEGKVRVAGQVADGATPTLGKPTRRRVGWSGTEPRPPLASQLLFYLARPSPSSLSSLPSSTLTNPSQPNLRYPLLLLLLCEYLHNVSLH